MDRVTNPQKLNRVLRMCRVASGAPATATRLPFETPCSIDRDTALPHPDALLVSPKADGVRYLLCLCVDDAGRPIATLVNRASEAFSVRVNAPESWFRLGCVFDGEMCELRTGRSAYLVFNVLSFRGELLFHRSYRDRVACMARAIPAEVLATEGARRTYGACVLTSATDAFDIVAKPVRPARELRELLREPLPYVTDGVVLTPLEGGMTTGRNDHILKCKWDNTIDVWLCVGEDNRYELMAANKGQPIPLSDVVTYIFVFDELLQSIVRGFRLLRKLLKLQPAPFKEMMELSVTPGITPMLTYLRMRTDKTAPNDLYTIQRTVVAAESAITAELLCEQLEKSVDTS